MAGEVQRPVVRRPFRILAGVLAIACFVLAAWFALGPDWRDAGLTPWIFSACGVVIAGLALAGSGMWRGGGERAEPGAAADRGGMSAVPDDSSPGPRGC